MRRRTLLTLIAFGLSASSCSQKAETMAKTPCVPDGSTSGCPGVLLGFFNAQPGVGKSAALNTAVKDVKWRKEKKTKRHSECDTPGPCTDDQEVRSAFRNDDPDFMQLPSGAGDVLLLATMSFVTTIPGHDARYKAGGSKVKDGSVFLLASKAEYQFGTLVQPDPAAGPRIGYWYLVRMEGADVLPVSYGEMHSCSGRDTSTTRHGADFYGCSLHVSSRLANPSRGATSVALAPVETALHCGAGAQSRMPRRSTSSEGSSVCPPESPLLLTAVRFAAELLGVRKATIDEIAALFVRADTALDAYWFPCSYGCCTA